MGKNMMFLRGRARLCRLLTLKVKNKSDRKKNPEIMLKFSDKIFY